MVRRHYVFSMYHVQSSLAQSFLALFRSKVAPPLFLVPEYCQFDEIQVILQSSYACVSGILFNVGKEENRGLFGNEAIFP